MAINVPYGHPFLQAILPFVAGTGAANREAKLMNRKQHAQQQQQLAQSIGGAIGDLGSAPFQAEIMLSQRKMNVADRLAEIQARSAANISERFVSKWGSTPDAMAEAAFVDAQDWTPPAEEPTVPPPSTFGPGEFGASLPDDGTSMTFPEPATPPGGGPAGYGMALPPQIATRIADQEAGLERVWSRDAQNQMARLDEAVQAVSASSRHSPTEKARTLAFLGHQRAQLRKVAAPKQPTVEEMVTKMTAKDPELGGKWYASAPGKLSYAQPQKSSEEVTPWIDAPTPEMREAAKRKHFEANHIGPVDHAAEYIFDPKRRRWEKQKPDKEPQAMTYKDALATVVKTMPTQNAEGEPIPVDWDKAHRETVKLLARANGEEATQNEPAATESPADENQGAIDAIGNQIRAMRAQFGRYDAMPAELQVEYDALIERYKALGGT